MASLGEHYLEVSENRTILARDAYTYLHVVFAHPLKSLPPYEVATVAAGPAVYLFAHTLFGYRLTGVVYKTSSSGRWPASR